jgi:hypothetical protein
MESQSIVKASELLAAAPAVAQEAASTTSASTSASSSSASAANATATVAATAPSASGNADADGAGSDNDVDDDDAAAPGADGAASAAKKKKKKNKKKKNKGLGGGVAGTGPGTPSGGYPITELLPEDPKRPVDVIMLGVGKAPTASASTDGTEPAAPRKDVHGRVQTSPPQIPVSYFYPDYVFPPGERMEYAQDWNLFRTTSEEKRAAELPNETVYNEVREAAEAHRIARQDIQKYLRPGVSLFDIATQLESSTARLMRKNPALYGVSRGWAFPTGLSLNHIAAHWSPNAGDKTVLGVNDVLKVDFGTQVNGRIIDSAFTVHFNHEYDGLVDACKDATETGVRVAGVDMRLGDIGGAIQEVRFNNSHDVVFGFPFYGSNLTVPSQAAAVPLGGRAAHVRTSDGSHVCGVSTVSPKQCLPPVRWRTLAPRPRSEAAPPPRRFTCRAGFGGCRRRWRTGRLWS